MLCVEPTRIWRCMVILDYPEQTSDSLNEFDSRSQYVSHKIFDPPMISSSSHQGICFLSESSSVLLRVLAHLLMII